MREISNNPRSISGSQAPGSPGDFTSSYAGEGYQDLIQKANTISLKKIFKMYGVRLDEINRKTTCPFRSHKGGHESTASFYYYPDTNTYCCYGCRQGSTSVDFVANMDRCHKSKAAHKILEKFKADVDEDLILHKEDFSEKMSIMMEYADAVRNFRLQFSDDKAFDFIENNCHIYDTINKKHDLTNEALRLVVNQLIQAINNYIP